MRRAFQIKRQYGEFARSTHIFAAVFSCHAAVPSSHHRSIAEISHAVVAYIHVVLVSCVLETSHYPRKSLRRNRQCFAERLMRKSVFVASFVEGRRERQENRASRLSLRREERNVARWEAGARLLECTTCSGIPACPPSGRLPRCRGSFGGTWRARSYPERATARMEFSRYFFASKSRGRGRDEENYQY